MIISASRRTDIPAFYPEWFMNRVRAGFCAVPNPFDPSKVARVDLRPEAVEAVVFWTRYPRPLFPHLEELDRRGFRYYFLFSLLDYPRDLDARRPTLTASLAAFSELSARIGPDRVVWRYDPIVLSNVTDVSWHLERFERLCEALCGLTRRSAVSFLEPYRKIARRMAGLAERGVILENPGARALRRLIAGMNRLAEKSGISVYGCAQREEYAAMGLAPGACVDAELLRRVFGLDVPPGKDSGQRALCRCAPSRDIGMYDSCQFGCRYCYATSDFAASRVNFQTHDKASSSLLGRHEPSGPRTSADQNGQGSLLDLA